MLFLLNNAMCVIRTVQLQQYTALSITIRFLARRNLFQCKCFPSIQKIPLSCYNNKAISVNISSCTVGCNTQIKEDSSVIIRYGNYKVKVKWYQYYFLRGKYVQISSFHFHYNPRDVKCFFQFVLNLLQKIETFPCVMLLPCYPVLLMMITDYFPVFPLFILGDKEVLLLSFYRQVIQLRRAKEICFRFHQKLVRKPDLKFSPSLFPSAPPVSAARDALGTQRHHSAVALLPYSTASASSSSLHPVEHNQSLVISFTSSQ